MKEMVEKDKTFQPDLYIKEGRKKKWKKKKHQIQQIIV